MSNDFDTKRHAQIRATLDVLVKAGMLKAVSLAKREDENCGADYEILILVFPNGQSLEVRSVDSEMYRSYLEVEKGNTWRTPEDLLKERGGANG